MRNNIDILQTIITQSLESTLDSNIKGLISQIKGNNETIDRFPINIAEFSLFLSSLNNEFNSSTVSVQEIKSSTSSSFKPFSYTEFSSKHRDDFVKVLKNSRLDEDSSRNAEVYFNKLLDMEYDGAVKLLEEVFISTLTVDILDEELQIGIINLLCNYDFNELGPTAQLIASSAYPIKSVKVKSSIFNLFGHWGNREALNMLKKYEEPHEPWLRMKYRALINSIEKKYVICKKN